MTVEWKPKKKLNVFETCFSEVVCAKVNGAKLKVYSFEGTEGLSVGWSVHRPNNKLHSGGSIPCTKERLRSVYEKAKKRAEMFARCWDE